MVVLEHRIVDAEYDLANDRIVTVSNDPAYLHVLDVDFGTVDSVALPTTATAGRTFCGETPIAAAWSSGR